MVPTVLQVAGVALFVLFGYAVWPPLALLVTGAFLFLVGLSLERTLNPIRKPVNDGSA